MVVSKDGVIVPGTKIAKVDENEKCKLEIIPASENKCCLLGNLLSSRGETCKVSYSTGGGTQNYMIHQ